MESEGKVTISSLREQMEKEAQEAFTAQASLKREIAEAKRSTTAAQAEQARVEALLDDLRKEVEVSGLRHGHLHTRSPRWRCTTPVVPLGMRQAKAERTRVLWWCSAPPLHRRRRRGVNPAWTLRERRRKPRTTSCVVPKVELMKCSWTWTARNGRTASTSTPFESWRR